MPSSPVKDEGTDDRRQRSVAATTIDGSEAAVAIIRSRPVALVSVIVPALRVILSFRLLRSVFRRENLRRFLLLPNLVTDGFCHGRLRV
jgi:hypothetical protein